MLSLRNANLIQLLRIIKAKVDRSETDTIWSKYNTTDDLLYELDYFIKRLTENDEHVIFELKILFAPTSSLQDVYINSGWGDQFLLIASQFD
ncbi:hypothetical protein J2Z69_001810 [Paenibacillus shirakamiensis]|uniref:Uncharacterized protein n=1 Tax=Paenibacillus shirakamiensis TaxID=1265935 RepID=A0ABS4JGD9_9BACL|nr:hypothetical protein [Paenibacillus shirakamiensis]